MLLDGPHDRPADSIPEPMSSDKPTLILDLDETLILSYLDAEIPHDHEITMSENGYQLKVYINVRPWVQYLLDEANKYFRVVVFTASERDYADPILDLLDPQNKLFAQRLYRDSCRLVSGVYTKDLSALGMDPQKTIIVDNSLHAFAFNVLLATK